MTVILLAVGVGSSMKVGAAEQPTGTPRPATGTPARIVFNDRAAKAITVDIRGIIYLLWLNSDSKVRKDGKEAGIADLAPGQMVKLTTKKNAKGDAENVVEITITSGDTASETDVGAGQSSAGDKINGRAPTSDQMRGIQSFLMPPSVTRPIVSPHY